MAIQPSRSAALRAVQQSDPAAAMNIGEVLTELIEEFPQISASKIRFLEDKGLITPHRTPAGYRKYTRSHVERLRFILALQRDQYLPLKVIKDYVEAIDRGERPEDVAPNVVIAPKLVSKDAPGAGRTLSLQEFAKTTGATERSIQELMSYGLLARKTRGFTENDVEVVRQCMLLARYGLDARYSRMLKAVADRQMELIQRAIAPTSARRDGHSASSRMEQARELGEICSSFNQALLRQGLDALEQR